jgi:DDE superfamily endonuclease
MALIIADHLDRIIYPGKIYAGSCVDITLFKEELQQWDYSKVNVWVDSGFTGIKNLIEARFIFIPYKKPPGGRLTPGQKAYNRAVSRIRVKVEHALAGMKRYYILRHESRIRKEENIDIAFELCASLWNYKREFTVKAA